MQHRAFHPWAAMQLLALLLLAALLRLYNLPAEVPWYDEELTLKIIHAPSLGAFLNGARVTSPAVPPVYFIAEYLWASAVSPSVISLRVLSILFSLVGLAYTYALAASLYDRRTGLLAVALLAVHTQHVFYSQEIRMYSLAAMLCMAAAYHLVQAINGGGGRHWCATQFFNALMVWTHPFCAFALLPQMLLVFLRFQWHPIVFAWAFAQSLLPLSAVAYVASRPSSELMVSTMSWLHAPTGLHIQKLMFIWSGFRYTNRVSPLIELSQYTAGILLACCLLLACLGIARNRSLPVAGSACITRYRGIFLLSWVLMPPLLLFVLSHVWTPMFLYRYVLYCLPAFLLLVSAGVRTLPKRSMQYAMGGTLFVMIALELLKGMSVPFRPEYVLAGG